MALNINTKYPGRVTAPSAGYPYGSSKNESAPGVGDGTPYELARADDIFGLQQALLASAGIVPSGNADTALVSEYLQSIVELASGRAFNYDESGIVNAYELDVQSNQQGPAGLFDGFSAEFTPTITNTTSSTADVNGTGVKNIVDTGTAGVLTAGIKYRLTYRLGTDDYEVEPVNNIRTRTKVWVNFNGIGVVAIRDSENVTSITDNATANYTVNIDTNFATANYSISHNASVSGATDFTSTSDGRGVGTIDIETKLAGVPTDAEFVDVQAWGDQ